MKAQFYTFITKYSLCEAEKKVFEKMAMKSETVIKAEKLVEEMMGGNDASHDAAHALRVRDLALSLAREEQLLDSSLQIVCVFFMASLHLLKLF